MRPMITKTRFLCLAWLGLALTPAVSEASTTLASDKGCYNCHGNPPKKNAPSFAVLAAEYQRFGGDRQAEARLSEKLRSGSIFSHVDAHVRLSESEAQRLIRWIIDGAH